MKPCSRRQFLKTTTVGTTAGLLAAPTLASAAMQAKSGDFAGDALVPLGKTGLKVSRLAQGTGYNGHNHSSEQTRAGKESFDRLMRHGLDNGITFLDMADLYGSHSFVADVLKGLPRDKFVLLSKIWPRNESWVTPSGGAKAEIERFRKELNTDRVDVCLIHCMLNDKWPTEYERIRDELSELKDRGTVKAVGVSCHDFGALKVAAEHPWVDVIFARINHKGGKEFSCDASAPEVAAVLKKARANGKAVVGMKIFGAGKLVKPEEKDTSLKYVFHNDLVDAVTIGMTQPKQVDDTMERMARV
jgi:aryl-alcohol dehydrogenase-like predicted oxidoreductase